MKNILLLGAGKSANILIDYLVKHAASENWHIHIGDRDLDAITPETKASERTTVFIFDLNDEAQRTDLITKADLVISMLPARFHMIIARDCLSIKRNLITPSYVSEEMKALDAEVKEAGLLFLNEMGLDPGIDHMSAMKIIHKLKADGYHITEFESFTGGLVAPQSDNNPWHYKFTWNPRNVVLAGQGDGGVKFLHNGRYKYIPYHKLFQRTELIDIDGYGTFEGYANRDSLKYQNDYGLDEVKTMYRGTFRRPPFCKAWHLLVQLGATDDTYQMEHLENMTHRDFVNSFLKFRLHDSIEIKLAYYLGIDLECEEMQLLEWLGLFDDKKIGLSKGSPAQVLQHILEQKWTLEDDDNDMIVMWHKFNFTKNGKAEELHSSMVVIGEDKHSTAMAKTVGLPIGIAAKMMLKNEIDLKGVLIPLYEQIYNPILVELDSLGISFVEKEV